jgi:arylformamidase
VLEEWARLVYYRKMLSTMQIKMNIGKAVDLTHTISKGMTTYVGDPKPDIKQVKKLEHDGVNLSRLKLGSHTGTHIDAPHHFVSNGITVDELDPEAFCGQAVVLDLSNKKPGSGITASDLKRFTSSIKPGDIVLLYTGMSEHWGEQWARRKFTYLDEGGAAWLLQRKVKVVGIDYLSVEKFASKENLTHKKLLGNGVLIIESLNKNLRKFLGKRIFLMCLPIKTKGTDGAPARVLAYPLIGE